MIWPAGCARPPPEAERIKRRHGCAASAFMKEDGAIEIASVGDRPPRTIFAHMLTDIIEPRAMELLALIRDDLQRAGLLGQIPAGFVLAGGGARLHGLLELAEESFHLPVRIAEPKGLADLPEQVAQPEYATVVGLVLCGAKARRSAPARGGNLVSKLKAMFVGASRPCPRAASETGEGWGRYDNKRGRNPDELQRRASAGED